MLISITSHLASCTPIVETRGHATESEDFKQIVIGQSSPDDVTALLGTPSARSTFGEETWYYITEKKETVGVFAPKVTEQNVTAIHFDANHVVASIDEHGKDEAKNVQLVEKTTPSEGRHLTVMEQMLGNLGRFSAPGRSISPRDLGH